jgi:hypothetical protein
MVRFASRRRLGGTMSWSRRLVLILTLRCEGASALASRELDEPMGAAERLAMWGHLLACGPCRRFRRQVRFLRRAIQERAGGIQGDGNGRGSMSPEAKARIERALAEAMRERDRGDRAV